MIKPSNARLVVSLPLQTLSAMLTSMRPANSKAEIDEIAEAIEFGMSVLRSELINDTEEWFVPTVIKTPEG